MVPVPSIGRDSALILLALLGAGAVVAAAGSYLVYAGYLDHGEATVAIISYRLLEGFEIYPAFDGPDRITNVYGPLDFLVNALAYALFGATVAAGKAAAFLSAVALPLVVGLSQRRHGGAVALAAAALGAGYALYNLPTSIWNRPDTFLALLGALAVWMAAKFDAGRRPWMGAVLLGFLGGMAVGFKIHGGIYLFPVAVFYWFRAGIGAFLLTCVAGAVTVLLPFALPNVSIEGYLGWFLPVAGKAASVDLLIKVARFAPLYLVPPLGFLVAALVRDRRSVDRGLWAYLAAFLVCYGIVVFPAVKEGAGAYYHFPFFPVAVDLSVRLARAGGFPPRIPAWALGIAAVLVLAISIPVQKRHYRALHWAHAEALAADTDAVLADYPGDRIEMGVGATGEGYRDTFLQPMLVFAGHPYTIDHSVVMELANMGMPLPDAALRRVRACETTVWLVPKGETPFTFMGYYGGQVYDDAFRDAFRRTYSRTASSRFFDIWSCRKGENQ